MKLWQRLVLLSSAAASPRYTQSCLSPGLIGNPDPEFQKRELDISANQTFEFCQQACFEHLQCHAFSYRSADSTCWDISAKEGSAVALVHDNSAISYAGDCKCPGSHQSRRGFPLADLASAASQFASGHQPAPLQCWPKSTLDRSLKECHVSVLRDTDVATSSEKYWKGQCQNFHKVILPAGDDCQSNCRRNPYCSSWQFVPPSDDYSSDAEGCFQGLGWDCNAERLSGSVATRLRAQRLQHGNVKVIVGDFTRYQLMALVWRFGLWDAGFEGDIDAVTRECRELCYSDIRCAYWQVYKTNLGSGDGCFTEDEGVGSVSYPLTLMDVMQTNDGDIYDGEYLQHWCEPDAPLATTTLVRTNPSTTVASTAAPSTTEQDLLLDAYTALADFRLSPRRALGAVGAGALLLCLCCWVCGCCRTRTPKDRESKRALKQEPQHRPRAELSPEPPEPPRPAPPTQVQPQPSPLFSDFMQMPMLAPPSYGFPVQAPPAAQGYALLPSHMMQPASHMMQPASLTLSAGTGVSSSPSASPALPGRHLAF